MPRLFLVVLMFAGFAGPAMAQNPVHRCVGSNGSPVFTDQPCSSQDATPIVAPAVASTAAPGAPTSVPILCATSVTMLRRAVAEAFASRDANRLSGLVLWNGYAGRTAIADIQSLSAMLRQNLLDFGPSGDAPEGGEPQVASHDLLVRTTSGGTSGAPLETRFGIVRQAGCLWLQP